VKTPNSLTFRLVGAAGLWTALALIAGGFLLSALFRTTVERSFDDRLAIMLEGLIGVAELADDGTVSLARPLTDSRFSRPYSGLYWQVTPRAGVPLRSRSLWDLALATDLDEDDIVEHRFTTRGPDDQKIRVIERDIVLPGGNTPLRFAVAADTTEMKKEVRSFNRIIGSSLALLGFGLISAVLFQVRYGLQPLRRIRRALASMRAGRTRRLGNDFPTEIMPLVTELNALLDHNAEVVNRARTHVGNLAHALKTPLSVLANESAASGEPDRGLIARQVDLMRRNVDYYLARARTVAMGGVIGTRTPVIPVVRDLCRTVEKIYTPRRLEFDSLIEGPKDKLVFAGERQDMEEMLGNLLDNAAKWARHRVRVTVRRAEQKLVIVVDDDGPGIAPERRAEVFNRGSRLDEQAPGTGLGLAIVHDVAGLCDGTVCLGDSPWGGLSVTLSLPASK